MFTGIIQGQGIITERTASTLIVDAVDLGVSDWELGESVSINGVCLTVVDSLEGLRFDVSDETWNRSNLGSLDVGDRVNLERAMTLGARLGGHIVQGHVDDTATLVNVEVRDDSTVMSFEVGLGGGRYLVDKGSIALDGISLTVVRPEGDRFEIWVIPHTLAVTTLGQRHAGDKVNVEYDVLAKHVERLLTYRSAA
jgi:riboflavin synthase